MRESICKIFGRHPPGYFGAYFPRRCERLAVELIECDPVARDVDEEVSTPSQVRVHLAQGMHDHADRRLNLLIPHQSIVRSVPKCRVTELLVVDDDQDVKIRTVALLGVRLVNESSTSVRTEQDDFQDTAAFLEIGLSSLQRVIKFIKNNLNRSTKLMLLVYRQVIEARLHQQR